MYIPGLPRGKTHQPHRDYSLKELEKFLKIEQNTNFNQGSKIKFGLMTTINPNQQNPE